MPRPQGHRFCVLYAPSSVPLNGCMLYVHPFAEEMNKCRRAAAMAARGLAADGCVVLMMDLLGCGDSSGDFSDASWSAWLDDVEAAAEWLQDRYSLPPVLWGMRAGCLLVCQMLARLATSNDLLLWQPVLSGKQHLAQFLRLKAAAEIVGGSTARTGTQALRDALVAGRDLHIAGYALGPRLALPLETAELQVPPGYSGRALWCEVSAEPGGTLSPASSARLKTWRDAGANVDAKAVIGLPFWQTQETADCPALEALAREFVHSLRP